MKTWFTVIVTVIVLLDVTTLLAVMPELEERAQKEGAVLVGIVQTHPLSCWQLDEQPS